MTMAMTTRQDAIAQGEAEYDALLRMLRPMSAADWARPTDCPAWTVREVVAHVNGAAEEAVSRTVQARHLLTAQTRDRKVPTVDSLSAQQVADREGRTPEELVAELERLGPVAPRARSKVPGLVRSRPMPADSGCLPGDTMGYLIDVIYARDVWMHRIDIARATGRDLVLTPDHDGRLVDDVSLFELLVAAPDTTLGELVAPPWPVVVTADAQFGTVVDRLIENRRSSIVVVDSEGRPIGRILADDVVDALVPGRGRRRFPRLLS